MQSAEMQYEIARRLKSPKDVYNYYISGYLTEPAIRMLLLDDPRLRNNATAINLPVQYYFYSKGMPLIYRGNSIIGHLSKPELGKSQTPRLIGNQYPKNRIYGYNMNGNRIMVQDQYNGQPIIPTGLKSISNLLWFEIAN